jgi:nucleoside-specific outer membrane channel protein Tsx
MYAVRMGVAIRSLAPLACVVALVTSTSVAHAEDFGNTNLQILYGANFHDRFLGTNTTSGKMGTATFEHFGAWAWGYNFLFVDFYQGNFADFLDQPTGTKTRVYGEWSPALSLRRITGHKGYGPIFRDIQLVAQFGRSGEGFFANMGGLGVELEMPSRYLVSIAGYARYDSINKTTWQSTVSWYLPYKLAGVGLLTTGFADISGTKQNGIDVFTQPQLLVDTGSVAGPRDTTFVGLEWSIHTNQKFTASVPQAMVRWNW